MKTILSLTLTLFVLLTFNTCKKESSTEQTTPTKPVVKILSPPNNAIITLFTHRR
ncbi:MAG: hypothetical protein KGZ58_10815 [Ignavibacteriales bacterium]|nr:hypothetical protein [Ignavibacteriales bacterium]